MSFDLSIIAVGRLKGAEEQLCSRYGDRINGIGRQLGIGRLSFLELSEARDGSATVRKDKEAAALLKKCPERAVLVALDERGQSHNSQKFAKMIATERDGGAACMAFVLGGPDGHGQEVLQQARHKLSLSPMTMPHGLARAVLLEQIYRALTILGNHPYHRE